ncbi:MAG: aldolase/citrate lyase family protein [Acidobacteriota bacterium]
MRTSLELAGRRFSLGPFLKCPHPEMVEACGLAGFDFAVADMEHTPLSPRDLYPLVLAAERRALELVVRVPANEESYIKWCLDLGVRYIQVPFVQCREDAEKAMSHGYFGPAGERGLCRFVRSADFSAEDRAAYLPRANAQTKMILQVEGVRGVENIDEILAVPGIDTLFIGPYDLSQSLGKPGQIWDDEVVAMMRRIVRACDAAGVKAGTFTDTPEGIRFWMTQGVQLIEYASDLNLFMGAVTALKQQVVGLVGSAPAI